MKKVLIILLLLYGEHALAQEVQDSVKIYFRQGYSELDTTIRGNKKALDRIADSLRMSYSDSIYKLQRILVVGSASPEGSILLNKQLSEKRAATLFNYLARYGTLPDSLKTTEFIGRDWNGLIRLAENDQNLPYREETLQTLRQIAAETQKGITAGNDHHKRIQQLCGGVPYAYLYQNLFPELRASRLYLWFEKIRNPIASMPDPKNDWTVQPTDTTCILDTAHAEMPVAQPRKPFYMDLRTNMLYDLLAIPNIGIEFYVGKNWSIAANWMYAWWKTDRRHWYWRTYGGDLALRKWFGKAAKEKPLTGHHIGIYGQLFTYDFEAGGKGYLGGKPGGTLWDKINYAAGVEYGYSLPVARRLNIDFTFGIGYWGGEYREYLPIDNCYVWQSTKQRNYFGPTKAEISLVWLIGRGNDNCRKGGKQ